MERIRQWRPLTISVPEKMLSQLDFLRHDVSRSKYIQRIIQDHMKLMEFLD